jgi:hypothetical protein
MDAIFLNVHILNVLLHIFGDDNYLSKLDTIRAWLLLAIKNNNVNEVIKIRALQCTMYIRT